MPLGLTSKDWFFLTPYVLLRIHLPLQSSSLAIILFFDHKYFPAHHNWEPDYIVNFAKCANPYYILVIIATWLVTLESRSEFEVTFGKWCTGISHHLILLNFFIWVQLPFSTNWFVSVERCLNPPPLFGLYNLIIPPYSGLISLLWCPS